jgi:23S rRNA (cytidine1920-2'-O)/16S rRNA (cytidine1409-2'-O)-methyltransferase
VKERADKILADKGLVSSRSQAKCLIENGDVSVNGKIIRKAGDLISPFDDIQINSQLFVGRGALKLECALKEFGIIPLGKTFVDVGASTGGFTEVLLNHGVNRVYAIDVGHNQLASKLRLDTRVVNLEGTNIKTLEALPELADGAVLDLSFISITKVLSRVRNLLKPQAPLIALVKPQFEVGRERLPKDGVIKDKTVQEAVLQEVIKFAVREGWIHHATINSPIEGKSGNREFLCLFTRS